MFSFDRGTSGCLALCSSMSCESRNAQAMPAGPPPTITTSASIAGRSMFSSGLRNTIIEGIPAAGRTVDKHSSSRLTTDGASANDRCHQSGLHALRLFHFFDQRRNDVEEIAHHRNVGDFKN